MATLNSHGLEPQEEAIMDLWDQALSIEEIAARLGYSLGRVKSVVRNFSDGGVPDLWAPRARIASANLIAAIARAHPEMAVV